MDYRILYLSQKPLGNQCLNAMIEIGMQHCIQAIVSNSEKNNWWASANEYEYAKKNNIYCIDNIIKNEELIINAINTHKINTIISVQHPWILSSNVLELVNYFAFNLHNAKIPDYKGYNSYNHAILNGEKEYFSTIHWIVDKVDMGDIAFEKSIPITSDTTSFDLIKRATVNAIVIFNEFIATLKQNKQIPRKSILQNGKFYGRNSLDMLREIKNINNYDEVDLKTRAFYNPPFDGCYYILNGKKFYINPSL